MMSNLYEKVAVLAYKGWSWGCDGLIAYTLTVAAVAIVCCAWWVKKFTKSKPPLPPGPLGVPMLGILPFIQPNLHQYFAKLSQIYGPIIKFQLGRKVCIVISSPSLAKAILNDHDAIFANHDTPAAAIAGLYGGLNILWRPNGPEFRNLRKLFVREIMSHKSIDAFHALRRREILKMVKGIYENVGSSINLAEKVFLTALSVLISMLWDGSLNEVERNKLNVELRNRVDEFLGLSGAPNISDLFPVLAPFDLQGIQSKTKKHLEWFYAIFESVIVQRTKKIGEGNEKEESKDFLQQLLELNQRDDDTSISKTEIKAVLVDILIGGTHTIPTTVEWAMTELLRHPEKMRRLIEELDTVVGNQNIVEEYHLPRFLYLEAVIKETLRLHPAAPLLVPRRPSMTSVVSGYTIPHHSRIFINAWAIQRDPEFWENPLQFEPERFLKDTEKGDYTGKDFRYFPFGSGRRICPGIRMAEKMVSYVLGVLVHSFEWKLPDGRKPDLKDKLGTVLTKTEPLAAIPVARLSNSLLYQ